MTLRLARGECHRSGGAVLTDKSIRLSLGRVSAAVVQACAGYFAHPCVIWAQTGENPLPLLQRLLGSFMVADLCWL